MIARASLACLFAAGLTACATPSGSSTAQETAPEAGPLVVTLLGNYVGRTLRIVVDEQVVVDGRLTFPPMGPSIGMTSTGARRARPECRSTSKAVRARGRAICSWCRRPRPTF
ncbi:hypothetical protein [Brevundimonas aveniformis]|uniref:hypothetical protein n=1 Tax=Brevundimonas aveniformis TaxID=370977 RepID=UPI0024926D07|nr:hypothetical protein [Brevundimonas aveniformis]